MKFSAWIHTIIPSPDSLRLLGVLLFFILLVAAPLPSPVFRFALFATYIGAVFLMLRMPQQMLADWLAVPPSQQETESPRFLHTLVLGAACICGVLAYLEWVQPFYFTQDDNHSQFFPVMLQAMRGVFEDFIFPTWNGTQLLGLPTNSLGYYGLTYPPLYLSYAISRFVLGNEYLTLEVLALAHILGGYVLCAFMVRALHVRSAIACVAALCFVLLGFHLTGGRSWYHVLSTTLWLPALGWSFVHAMHHRLTLKWMLLTGLCIGLYAHSGNVQMWVYGCIFWGVGMVLAVCAKRDFEVLIRRIIPAGLVGVALALPLLLVQYLQTVGIGRPQVDISMMNALGNLIIPWPVISSEQPWVQINPGTLYFFGGVFVLLAMVRIAFEMAGIARSLPAAYTLIFSMGVIITFVLMLGSGGLLWDWLAKYPPFDKFRVPLRLLSFFAFFSVVAGALMLESMRRKLRHGAGLVNALMLTVVLLTVYNAAHCQAAFYVWADKPYPELNEKQQAFRQLDFDTKQRLYPVSQIRSPVPLNVITLGNNYPTVYNIPVVSGYYTGNLEVGLAENIFAGQLFNSNRPLYYREYGVEWILISKLPGEPRPVHEDEIARIRSTSFGEQDLDVADAFLVKDAQTKPMAYVEAHPETPLEYRLRTDGVDIKLDSFAGGKVVANFLHRAWFKGYTQDNVGVRLEPDGFKRIVAEVPAGATVLQLRYEPPWHYGLILGFAALMFAWALMTPPRKR